MQAGNQPFEMIAAVFVSDGVGAVLKHDADALNALGFTWIECAAAFSNAADERESFADAVAHDADDGIDCAAGGTAVIRCRRQIECVARACILPHFGEIGE